MGTENLGTLGSPMVVLSHFASKIPAIPGLRSLRFLLDLLTEWKLRRVALGQTLVQTSEPVALQLGSVPAFPPLSVHTGYENQHFPLHLHQSH